MKQTVIDTHTDLRKNCTWNWKIGNRKTMGEKLALRHVRDQIEKRDR